MFSTTIATIGAVGAALCGGTLSDCQGIFAIFSRWF